MSQILLFLLGRQDFRHVRKTGYAGVMKQRGCFEKNKIYYYFNFNVYINFL